MGCYACDVIGPRGQVGGAGRAFYGWSGVGGGRGLTLVASMVAWTHTSGR